MLTRSLGSLVARGTSATSISSLASPLARRALLHARATAISRIDATAAPRRFSKERVPLHENPETRVTPRSNLDARSGAGGSLGRDVRDVCRANPASPQDRSNNANSRRAPHVEVEWGGRTRATEFSTEQRSL
jgi:hypothetical protein